MSRHAAAKEISFEALSREMGQQKVKLLAADKRLACEEAPAAYKDVDAVVETVTGSGLARVVARTRPLLVIKG